MARGIGGGRVRGASRRSLARVLGTVLALGGGGGGGGATVLPLYARAVYFGDSLMALAVGSFMKSVVYGTTLYSAGRQAYAESGDASIPGTRLTLPSPGANGVADSALSRVPHVTEQKPDIILVNSGHNDAPSTTGNVANILAWQVQVRDALRLGNPNAIIVWPTILPSIVEGSDTTALANLATVNNARLAWDGTDGGKTIVVDVNTGFNYVTMTQAIDGVHLNSLGQQFVSSRFGARLAPLFPASTIDAILSEQTAQGNHGPNIVTASKYALQGTAGTTTNTGSGSITGSVPTGYEVNNTTSAAVTTTLDTSDPNYTVLQLDITGTVSVEGYVRFGDPTGIRTAINAQPGEWFETLWGASLTATDGIAAPTGVLSFGGALPLTVPVYTYGNYLNADTNANGNIAVAYPPGVHRGYPRVQQSLSTNAQNAFGIRLAAGTVNARLRLWKPNVRRTFLTPLFKPLYAGNDGIRSASELLGVQAGTVASGNAITLRYGTWSGGALSFGAIRVYKGGTSGGAFTGPLYGGTFGIGTGELLATLAAGTVGWTVAGATAGDTLYIECDVTNSFGTTTARSVAIAVA